jgi:Mannosylglycerate hydrolase MGH1-like glycoside hydrolase domain
VGSIGDDIHQDVYLAAVWIRAALAMGEMAAAQGDALLAGAARALGQKARASLEARYWIESAGHHAFGVLRSGRTNDTLTVWPATAAAFGLLDPDHARRTLTALSGHALTTDWGARMLTTTSPLYDPTHYNMGAVWPFVTGFLALGHYQYGRPWAGYPLVDALSQMAFDWARGRHPELLSGAFYRPLDTAVPQQFFATSMLASSVAYGTLGFDPDAPRGRARLAPQLPPQWKTVRVSGLRAGGSRLDVEIVQAREKILFRLQPSGTPLVLELRPEFPEGARDRRVLVGGHAARIGPSGLVELPLDGRPRTVEADWKGGLSLEPPTSVLDPGQPDRGVRVLDFALASSGWRLVIEGPAGGTATLRLHGEVPSAAQGATLLRAGGVTEATLAFPAGAERFARAEVVLVRRSP